jgi:hypothetical protein
MKIYLQCMKGTNQMKIKDVVQGLIHHDFQKITHDLNLKIFNLITRYCDCKIKIGI